MKSKDGVRNIFVAHGRVLISFMDKVLTQSTKSKKKKKKVTNPKETMSKEHELLIQRNKQNTTDLLQHTGKPM